MGFVAQQGFPAGGVVNRVVQYVAVPHAGATVVDGQGKTVLAFAQFGQLLQQSLFALLGLKKAAGQFMQHLAFVTCQVWLGAVRVSVHARHPE